jgi:hypothetical protein
LKKAAAASGTVKSHIGKIPPISIITVVEKDALVQSETIVKRFAPILEERTLGGTPMLDVRPKGWIESRKVAVYVHGGAQHSSQREIDAGKSRNLLGRQWAPCDLRGLHTGAGGLVLLDE